MTKLGLNAKTYRNSGTGSTPAWTEITNIRDLTLTDAMSEADVTRRASGGYRETVPTLREASIDFDMVNIAGDADMAAISTAYSTRALIEVAVMDGGITVPGSRGLRATCSVLKFERTQELENAQMISVTLKPSPATAPPTEMVIN
jgi:hypothetical protein